jgi:O-antigen ligase
MLTTLRRHAQGPVDVRAFAAGLFWFLHCSFLLPLHRAQVGLEVPGTPVYLGLYLLSVFLVWARVTTYRFALLPWLRRGWPLVALPVLAVVSVVWSINPSLTAYRGLLWLTSTLTAIRICHQLSLRECLRALGWTLAILNLLSLAVVILVPDYGIQPVDGVETWRGFFSQKNYLGRFAALSLIIFATQVRARPALWGWHMAVAAALLLGSRSTSAIGFLGLVGLFFLGPRLARRLFAEDPGRLMGLLAVAMAALLMVFSGDLLQLMGKDWTLTGRTKIYLLAILAALQRPFFGFGFYAFWSVERGPANGVWGFSRWINVHAHNSFIDLWLGLGAVGVVCGLAFLVFIYLQSRGAAGSIRQPVHTLTRVLLVWCVLGSLTESFLFMNNIYWLLLVSLSDYLSVLPERP